MSAGPAWRWVPRGILLGLLFFAIFGPLSNLVIWSLAEAWYFPNKLPSEWGFRYWERVFRPAGRAMDSLEISVIIALFTVVVCLVISIPAG